MLKFLCVEFSDRGGPMLGSCGPYGIPIWSPTLSTCVHNISGENTLLWTSEQMKGEKKILSTPFSQWGLYTWLSHLPRAPSGIVQISNNLYYHAPATDILVQWLECLSLFIFMSRPLNLCNVMKLHY